MVGGRTSMSTEDLTEIENAGRRCGVCHSGRGWRRFKVVRSDGREPIVLCGSCQARFGNAPPVESKPTSAPEPTPAPVERVSRPKTRAGDQKREPPPDRLQAALKKLPGTFSTAMAARAAGISDEKALARLTYLERRGEIQRVGKRWSTESAPSDLAAAMDRLAARTSNLRIVREPERVS
jgi:hypothetical protein